MYNLFGKNPGKYSYLVTSQKMDHNICIKNYFFIRIDILHLSGFH